MSGAIQLLLAAKPPLVPDPYFEYTTLLLPGNGTNGAQNNTFLDSSTNAFSITRNGNTTQGTFSPFSQTGWSNFFDGSGDWLNGIGTTSSFNFMHNTSALFTIETWVYITSATDKGIFANIEGNGTDIGVLFYIKSDGNVRLFIPRGVTSALTCDATSSGTTVPLNTWTHIAVTYDQSLGSANAKFYINGVAAGTGNKTGNTPSSSNATSAAAIMGTPSGASTGACYFSNYRVTNSVVYTGAFTPPTTPLTAIADTKLLTCQSNRFIDNSTNAFAITRNGDVSVQAFSPFNPTAAWSAATYGGSGYFDGSGDYLTVGTSTAFSFGTGDFTLEYWVYKRNASTTVIVDGRATATAVPWSAAINSSEYPYFYDGATEHTSSVAVTLNAWNHVAIARSSSTLKIFVNGVQGFSGTVTTNLDRTAGIVIAARAVLFDFVLTGYLSGLRIVKGSAVYTAAFTPPTAPPTAISNTQFLLNFTNAGIYDATSKNDLETVGNAQISTTQSKFGGSSMYFDGTGDYLVPNVATSDLYAFGSGDWTVEMWVYSATNQSAMLLDWRPTSTSGAYITWYLGTGVPVLFVNAADRIIGGSAIPTNEWVHLAICRASGSTKMFVNGTQSGSTYSDSNVYLNSANRPLIASNGFTIGGSPSYFTGYINDLRITKGYARYTANFTAPTAAFPIL